MRTILATLIGLPVLLVLPLAAHSETPARRTFEVEAIKDVAYYEGKDAHPVKHKLDLFLPKDHKDFPVLFFVHGGSWRHGDKDFLGGIYGNIGRFFARRGIGAVVINYRLSPAVQHPEHIKDVARAFAWVHKNLPRYGCRADQIFLFGHSAGGHLVALLATDPSYLKAEGLTPRDIRGVVAMSGVYEIPQRLFAQVFGTDPEARKQASPLHHTRGGLAPFLILYADKDFPGCDKAPAEAFAMALKEKGNSVKTVEIANSNHYQIILSAGLAEHPVSQAILSFITTQVSKPLTPDPAPQRGEGRNDAPEKIPAPQLLSRSGNGELARRASEGSCPSLARRANLGEKDADKDEPAIVETLDVPYHDESERQKLDVFAPREAKNCPVIVFVHGGAWVFGDKNMRGLYRGVGRFLARHGMVAVLPNYRLSPAVKHPEHVKDIARAFAWTRRHVAEYGGDPDRIFLSGHSAGAHLVALLATDPRYLKDKELKLTDRDRAALQGVIAVSGVYRIPGEEEFRELVPELVDAMHEMSGHSPYLTALLPLLVKMGQKLNLFHLVFGTNEEVCRLAAPLAHVHKGLPPFLLLHGERDVPGLPAMAREFRDALKKAGDTVELDEIEDHGHNSIVFRIDQPNDPTAQTILKFIHQVLSQKAKRAVP